MDHLVEDTVVVFTSKNVDEILKAGGSQAWTLNPARTKRCTWLVCTQNRYHETHHYDGSEVEHGAGFLIGRISGLREVRPGRWLIQLNDYVLIEHPKLWNGQRNPVRYTSLATLDIDPESLTFQAMPLMSQTDDPLPSGGVRQDERLGSITIDEAKKGLALTFGVKPEAIEITIRG